MRVLIIIPAYNEEANIEKVVENLSNNYSQYDYVIVNDGSKDKTSKICHEKGYNIIDLPINLGLAGAFQTGLKYAYQNNYDYAIQLDADGQHLPEYIEPIMNEFSKGYNIVIGSRFVKEKKPKTLRMLGSNLISKAIYITTGNMISEFATNINYGPEPDTISFLLKQGVKVGEVQVKMEERVAGESYLNFTRSMWYMTKMLVSILVLQNFRKRNFARDEEN